MATAEPKYHRMYYNFIAKRLRDHYPEDLCDDSDNMRMCELMVRDTIHDIALECADRFSEDNPDFDPLAFLDQCSPDPEAFPFSELWEPYQEAREYARSE